MQLWQQAGANDLAGLIQAEWESIAGPPERLTDAVPELGDVLREEVREVARCQRVKIRSGSGSVTRHRTLPA